MLTIEKIREVAQTAKQCEASLQTIQLELLCQLVSNSNRIVQLLESQQPGGQMELPLTNGTSKPAAPASTPAVPAEPKKAAPRKAAAPKPAPAPAPEPEETEETEEEEVEQQAPAKAAPVANKASILGAKKVETKLPTQEEVVSALENWIVNHPDGDDAAVSELSQILKELGNYVELPQVPAEKYSELLERIA